MGWMRGVSDRVPARLVLGFMLFLGFMVTFLLRVNINLSIVAMVNRTAVHMEKESNPGWSPCIMEQSADNDTLPQADTDGDFVWDEMTQSIILGSFFWGYLVFQVPGGRVAEVYGTKRVFGGAVLLCALLSLVLPLAARLHWALLLVIRTLQGLAQGVQFPALSACTPKWIPLKERAKFMAFTACGASLGTVVSLPLCGFIIKSWGWEMVFYMSGILGVIWSAAWWVLVFDFPEKHPRITEKEKRYLVDNLEKNTVTRPVPWKAVLTSGQFWLGCCAAWGNDWGFHTFITMGPKYIKEALGFDLNKSSWLTSLPFLCQYVFATLYGTAADKMLERGTRLIIVRKASVIVSHLLPAFGLVLLAILSCQVTGSIIIFTASVAFIGAFSTGFFQNPLDIAPNYAGVLTGIMNGFGSLTGVVSTPLAGAILHNIGYKGWPFIFCIAAGMYTLSCLPYLLLAKGKLQPWNKPKGEQLGMTIPGEDQDKQPQESELQKLQPA